MKKIFMGTLLCLTILSGCTTEGTNQSNNSTDQTSSLVIKDTKSSSSLSTNKSTENQESSESSLETDGLLEKPGQYKKIDNELTITLNQINSEQPSIMIDKAKITILNSKIFEVAGNLERLQAEYSMWDINESPLHYLQVNYKVENTGEESLRMMGVDTVMVDTGQQFSFGDKQKYENNGGDTLLPGAFEEEMVIVQLDKDNLDFYKINFGPTVTSDGYEITKQSDTLEIRM